MHERPATSNRWFDIWARALATSTSRRRAFTVLAVGTVCGLPWRRRRNAAAEANPTSLRDGPSFNVRDYGAVGDGETDDVPAIQRAIDAAVAAGGGVVYVPAGTHVLRAITLDQDPNKNRFLTVSSNVALVGSGTASILKVADHLFDQPGVNNNAHILAGTSVDSLLVADLSFDHNGPNNLTPDGHIRNTMAIRLQGGNNLRIERCTFKNCSGHNYVYLNAPGVGASIVANTFRNGGRYVGNGVANLNNPDFSFLYSEWAHSSFAGNHIEEEDLDIALSGYAGGIEVHGSQSSVTNNVIVGCDPAIYVVSWPGILEDVAVTDNRMLNCLRGISFVNEFVMRRVEIARNAITLQTGKDVPEWRRRTGIEQPNGSTDLFEATTGNAGAIENLVVAHNTISCRFVEGSNEPAQGMVLHSLLNARIVNNVIDDMTDMGIVLLGSPFGATDLVVEGNIITNCGRGGGNRSAIGVNIDGAATVPPHSYFVRNVFIRANFMGNVLAETYDEGGALTDIRCAGHQWYGIRFINLTPTTKVEAMEVGENISENLLSNLYGTADPLHPEQTNSGVRFHPNVICSQAKPLTNRQLFGRERIFFCFDDSSERCTKAGYVTEKTGTVTGTSGGTSLTCNDPSGLRVGMILAISGASVFGDTLLSYLVAIDNTSLTLLDQLGMDVKDTPYKVVQPAFTDDLVDDLDELGANDCGGQCFDEA